MYSEHYGLSGRPFQLTPDPAFYFESQTHRKAMAYLGYGLAQGEGFIVITGDIGAGKTTLVGHLMETIDRSRLTVARLVTTQVDGDDILRLVAQGLGLATEGVAKAQLLDRAERFLLDQARGGKRTLLIVDEAQNLPVSALEELRMLSNFQSGGHALLQIFLLGQPEFRDKLQTEGLEQLRQRVIATHHLEPMNADEIGPYVGHRLSLVGWQRDPLFTEDAYAMLYRHSHGVPRKLNTLAGRALLLGAIEKLERINGAAVETIATELIDDDTNIPPAEAEQPRIVVDLGEKRLAAAAPAASPVPDVALAARVAVIEARLEEQDAALRRVLGLLVDWVESEEARPRGDMFRNGVA